MAFSCHCMNEGPRLPVQQSNGQQIDFGHTSATLVLFVVLFLVIPFFIFCCNWIEFICNDNIISAKRASACVRGGQTSARLVYGVARLRPDLCTGWPDLGQTCVRGGQTSSPFLHDLGWEVTCEFRIASQEGVPHANLGWPGVRTWGKSPACTMDSQFENEGSSCVKYIS